MASNLIYIFLCYFLIIEYVLDFISGQTMISKFPCRKEYLVYDTVGCQFVAFNKEANCS